MEQGKTAITFQTIALNEDYFKQMYYDYYTELYQFIVEKDEKTFDEIYNMYMSDTSLRKYFIVENGRIKGFLIVQYIDEIYHVHKPIWYICEFYIKPEYRRQWVGFKAMLHFIETRGTDFFLEILKKNTNALSFWKSIETRCGLTTYKRSDIHMREFNDTTMKCYKKGKPSEK